jgi:hypothetical protein
MMKPKKPDPELRELPSSSQFSAPHVQCRAGAIYLLDLLEEQTMLLDIAVDDEGGTEEAMFRLAAEGALERQALSEAVQVFAGMTIESAINLLGVMALGEEQFLRQVERRPPKEKLSTLLRVIENEDPSDDDELLAIVARLAGARNAFVHPKPQEGLPRPSQRERRPDLRSAREAVKDMGRFLELLQRRNRRYGLFFVAF